MEEQTAKSDVRDGQQNDIPLLESMLLRLMSQKKKCPKRSTFKSQEHPDATCQNVFYHSLESEERIANEDGNDVDSTVRSDGDEEQPTRSSETEDGNEGVKEFRGPPDEFHKCEKKSFPPVSLSIQTQAAESSRGPKDGELLEDRNNKEPSVEEHTAGAASLLNNPCQQSSVHTSHLSMSSERCDTTQMELKHEQLDDGPSKPVGMDTSSVLTHQTAVNVTSRTARSTSDPVAQKRKEERPLSAPSISNLRECENMANTMKSFSKGAMVLGWEDSDMSFGGMEQENLPGKMQKKGVKNKMKNLTHKLMEKLKEKHDCEHTDSKGIQDSGEEDTKCLNSMEMEVEAPEVPPPLPPKKRKYVFLERTFTLKDFKLNLEPINLMEEIFTGNEWLNYLPSKTSPAEKDTSDQPMAYVLQTEKDTQLNIPRLTPQQDQSEENNQDHVSDAQQDNVAKVNCDLDANTFAIPKTLLTNNAIKQMVSGIDCVSKKSDDIYDCLNMYIIPKNDLPLIKMKSLDDPLMDFSAVKSFELLDNSALRSRIHLSQKRTHKPPKKVKKEKSNAKFYKIPGDILNESSVSASQPFNSIPFSKSPPHHSPLYPDHT